MTTSRRKETFDTALCLKTDEAQRFSDRDLQKQWAEKDSVSVVTFFKHAGLRPMDLVGVVERDGATTKMRVRSIEGSEPGIFRGPLK